MIKRLLRHVNMGGSKNGPRGISPNVLNPADGAMAWTNMRQRLIDPLLVDGIGRVTLHNWAGMDGPSGARQMLFRAPVNAALEGHGEWLIDGFSAAWAPYIDQGGWALAYMGCPLDADGNYGTARRCLDMPLCGCAVGFDASMDAADGSSAHSIAMALRGLSVPVYMEAVPRPDAPMLSACAGVIANQFAWDSSQEGHQAIRRDELVAMEKECIEIVMKASKDSPGGFDPIWAYQECMNRLLDGRTVTTRLDLIYDAVSYEQWIELLQAADT